MDRIVEKIQKTLNKPEKNPILLPDDNLSHECSKNTTIISRNSSIYRLMKRDFRVE